MSRTGTIRRAGLSACLALLPGLASVGFVGSAMALEGPPSAPIISSPVVASDAPGTAVTIEEPAEPDEPSLPDNVQVVRFQGPPGVKIEVLGPAPVSVPQGDGKGIVTLGLKVGVGYKLRISNLPDRPELELFPVIEIVGHLHRPANIDPGKFPIRVAFTLDDLFDAADRGRLITQVVYLEDPEQALPIKTEKDEPPSVMLNSAEEPLKVGAALGRVMAIVRIGGRKPTATELTQPMGDGLAVGNCPFTTATGDRCGLPCGPVRGTPPPATQRWLPRDEYLCDGGDHGTPVHFAGDGGLTGIDPRDALVTFSDDKRPRVLPTNTVCIYAPRFASVRAVLAVNESLVVTLLRESDRLQSSSVSSIPQGPKRLAQNTTAETNRTRVRASGLGGRVFAGEKSELRLLNGYDAVQNVASNKMIQGPESVKRRVKAAGNRGTTAPVTFQKGVGATVTGVYQGASLMVMTWTPREVAGSEPPPARPGISVIKQVSVDQAEPGDTVTFTIRYKNMGNTPIRAVSVVDSLMPRLEYVAKSALGPANTIFTSGQNKAGSVELRWDLPGALAPGSEGYVSFRAIVR